ncbi:[acyl-carrier-protein] S-malonyltransferase [Acidihalobacter yilgarnensis]|uniref:Malonyl CoA-acyl carrier protein transacylase n=1 Tax=Acidihalobacter yilgarnensis TaxID=2819280 RepID=A0A1D8INQ8_9GAMM|nr:ACP S-malonyltransferase [Acidihalobacter yilgarnensis]AOU98103.1 [acyl-carrier-protein] S-malonyltransferase [Acidihalobacter yilgarnensis]
MSIAAVFPGQGSQSIGMLAALSDKYPQVRETFQEASDCLGYDLWSLVQNGPEGELGQTAVTQPAMLAAGVAVWRAWEEEGGCRPEVMAGHSLGEYTALVCAGALSFGDAVRVVAERGRLMQSAVPEGEGAMAAILGLTDDQVVALCTKAATGEIIEAVNFNAPGQVVVAGHAAAVARLMALATDAGAKRVIPLSVSVPSHCALMRPAAESFGTVLRGVTLSAPRVPVIHNADVVSYTDPASIADALVRQLYSPVRWVETIEGFADEGIRIVFEFGPGKVLSGLNKRIDRSLKVICVDDVKTLDAALELCEEYGA